MINRRNFCSAVAASALCSLVGAQPVFSGNVQAKKLPAPVKSGNLVMQALSLRRSSKGMFSAKHIPEEVLSGLFWAAWGVNRADGKRTAPTALNSQEVDLYALLSDGVWLYDFKNHSLDLKMSKDFRSKAGGGQAVFIYSAPEGAWAGMHVGSIYQNANIYAASVGLGAHVHSEGSDTLEGILSLPIGYRFWIAQSFGYVS